MSSSRNDAYKNMFTIFKRQTLTRARVLWEPAVAVLYCVCVSVVCVFVPEAFYYPLPR